MTIPGCYYVKSDLPQLDVYLTVFDCISRIFSPKSYDVINYYRLRSSKYLLPYHMVIKYIEKILEVCNSKYFHMVTEPFLTK